MSRMKLTTGYVFVAVATGFGLFLLVASVVGVSLHPVAGPLSATALTLFVIGHAMTDKKLVRDEPRFKTRLFAYVCGSLGFITWVVASVLEYQSIDAFSRALSMLTGGLVLTCVLAGWSMRRQW